MKFTAGDLCVIKHSTNRDWPVGTEVIILAVHGPIVPVCYLCGIPAPYLIHEDGHGCRIYACEHNLRLKRPPGDERGSWDAIEKETGWKPGVPVVS
jgi:hypothetical protein